MKRDDYISKLFQNSRDKLDEQPRNEVWDRLSQRLDKLDQQGTWDKKNTPHQAPIRTLHQLSRWMAAAAVVLTVGSLALLYQYTQVQPKELAQQNEAPTIQPTSIPEHRTASPQFEQEDLAQKEKLQNPNTQTKKSTELPTPSPQTPKPIIATEEVASTKDLSRNYQAPPPPPPLYAEPLPTPQNNNAVLENQGISPESYANIAKEDIAESESILNDFPTNTINSPSKASPRIAESKQAEAPQVKAEKSSRTKAQSKKRTAPNLHPNLQNFQWLLGRWEDTGLNGGDSYEEWSVKDPNTIQGKGFKILGKDKLFEERFTIEYRPQASQIFLLMPLDDTRKPIEYLLTRFEVDQIVFTQNEQPNYPNRIIFQREKNDQIILVMEKDSPIPSNQQNYLQNRNRVSNTRIVRNLRYKN